MATTALRQLLKSLCKNSQWNYAVLWKLRHGNPLMILTWEDGYFDHPKPGEFVENLSNDTYFNGGSDVLSSVFNASSSNGISGGHHIGLLVADMSHHQYQLGEGVVGEVALTGNDCWVSFNNIFSGEVGSNLVSEFPDEWLLQFASGIKTILLVPVLPHGVLQLGSLEEVAEDFQTIYNIKGRFNGFHNVGENPVPFIFKRDFEGYSSPISSLVECLNAPSAIAVKYEDSSYSTPFNDMEQNKENITEALKCERENKNAPLILTEVSTSTESMSSSELEMAENKLFELSCLMEELQAYSDCTDYNVFGESFDGIMNTYPSGDMTSQPFGGKNANDVTHKNMNSFPSFPKGCELHKALGPAFPCQTNEKMWNQSFLVDDSHSSSNLICKKDLSDRTDMGAGVEHLLQAVVGNAYSGSDDTCSNRSITFSSSKRLSQRCSPYSENQFETAAVVGDDSTSRSHLTSDRISGSKNTNDTTSTALKSVMSTVFDQSQQERQYKHMHPRKGRKLSNVNRRRAGPSESQKPRPRDRQLIQDRIKELRELVPNSCKCSIDGLLDQTIKHMLYLRSVTDQADKLSQWVHKEVADCKNRRLSETNDNTQNGTSWAFEFGSELQTCPIVVEDLANPGHMLIEMLCNDRGLFLEIAQVIRNQNLTILKGVMECRSNDTWAHFIVEASNGFHRLDIFWPLMQLLQRKRNPISSKI